MTDKSPTRLAVEAKFNTLEGMVGKVRRLIVYGPPGVGKTYGVEKNLKEAGRTVEVVRGGLSAIGLFIKLWETRGPACTLVIDDCDNILTTREGIDLLKAALDTHDPRRVQWNKMNKSLQQMGIDNQFEYEGQIVFITNMNLQKAKPKSRQPDFDALMDRASYLDLKMDSLEAKLERCKMVLEGGMLSNMLSVEDRGMLFEYLSKFSNNFREVSLRTLIKMAEAKNKFPNWEEISAVTLMNNPPVDAYSKFTADGSGAVYISKGNGKNFADAGLVNVWEGTAWEKSVPARMFSQEDIDAVSNEHKETVRRITILDNYFLVTPFSKRPKTISDAKGKTASEKARNFVEARGYKDIGIRQVQLSGEEKTPPAYLHSEEELYDFILENIGKFESLDDNELKRMVSIYNSNAADWKKIILNFLTRKGISSSVPKKKS